MQGLVSDVALKRKIRNYVYLSQSKPNGSGKLAPGDGYDLHVKQGTVLNENLRAACDAIGLPRREDDVNEIKEKAKNRPPKEVAQLQEWLCKKFYDIRAFGSVLSTGPNGGQLRGPVQISFARSIDPVPVTGHIHHPRLRYRRVEGHRNGSQGGHPLRALPLSRFHLCTPCCADRV